MRRGLAPALLSAVFFISWSAPCRAQDDTDISALSRPMRLGIRYYEKGEDTQAMDQFMDVLTRGDPAERNMANEYINLITHRMNSGEKDLATRPSSVRPVETLVEPAKPAASSAPSAPRAPAAPEVVVERAGGGEVAATAMPLPGDVRFLPRVEQPVTAAPRPMPATPSYEAPLPQANKALMKKEIRAKIRNMVEVALRELKSNDDIKILMREDGDPDAIAIPTPLLFQSGIAFHKDAEKILDALTRLTYGLGTAQAVILPEGTALGDAKVLDMRRTMGISSYLYSAGVAPARVRVNLLNTQVDIPKPLQEFKGIVILFVYNQPLGLVVESSLGEEAGPPLSLGVFPPSIRPDRGEGAIIEFSVEDPPAGLVSWKFQLLQPAASDGRDLAPLQEVVGGSPVFHQIYWNGKQNYFGSSLAPGRYECVLTATDAKNRQRALHKWIQVIDSAGNAGPVTAAAAAAPKPGAAAAPAAPKVLPSGAPSADLSTAPPERLIKEGKPKRKSRVSRRKSRKNPRAKAKAPAAEPGPSEAAAAPEPSPAPAATQAEAAPAAAPKPSKPSSGGYTLDFNRNSYQMTPDAERQLGQIKETMVYYPMENLKIIGYAQGGESDSGSLAQRRAQMVAGLLINKYQVDANRVSVESHVADLPGSKVQVIFAKSE